MTFVFDSKYGVRVKSTLVLDVNKTKLVAIGQGLKECPSPYGLLLARPFEAVVGGWNGWIRKVHPAGCICLSLWAAPRLALTAGQQWSCHTDTKRATKMQTAPNKGGQKE